MNFSAEWLVRAQPHARSSHASGNPLPTFITSDVIAAISNPAHIDVKGARRRYEEKQMTTLIHEEQQATTRTMTRTVPPERLLAFWKEIDDKTFGKGFD